MCVHAQGSERNGKCGGRHHVNAKGGVGAHKSASDALGYRKSVFAEKHGSAGVANSVFPLKQPPGTRIQKQGIHLGGVPRKCLWGHGQGTQTPRDTGGQH